MATHTRVDLINRVLRNLGALPEGQSPNLEEFETVDRMIEPTIASLAARNIIYISVTDLDLIPDEYITHLGHCVAWACAPEFGAGADVALAALGQRAEIDLEEIRRARPAPDPKTMCSDYPNFNRLGRAPLNENS